MRLFREVNTLSRSETAPGNDGAGDGATVRCVPGIGPSWTDPDGAVGARSG